MLTLYKNIKARRIELKMTQEQLALKLGYSDKGMISKIEKGLVDLSISKVIEFAEALNTEPSLLMGWNDPRDESTNAGSSEDNLAKLEKLYDSFDASTIENQIRALELLKSYLPHE